MAIPAAQLDRWATLYNPGTAQAAHVAVREALARRRTEVWMRQVSDYLQGSYRNATSIYRDTDVDLVLEWTGVCNYDFSALGFNDQIRARVAPSSPPPYQFPQFRADVLDALQREF